MMKTARSRVAVVATPTLAASAREHLTVDLQLRQRAAVSGGHFQVAVDACRHDVDDATGDATPTASARLMRIGDAYRHRFASDEKRCRCGERPLRNVQAADR